MYHLQNSSKLQTDMIIKTKASFCADKIHKKSQPTTKHLNKASKYRGCVVPPHTPHIISSRWTNRLLLEVEVHSYGPTCLLLPTSDSAVCRLLYTWYTAAVAPPRLLNLLAIGRHGAGYGDDCFAHPQRAGYREDLRRPACGISGIQVA